jgi:hypothetical protein
MGRSNEDFENGRPEVTPDNSPRQNKPGSLHKGKSGYYEEHHSSNRYIRGCKNCMSEEKTGKHPLA